MNHITLTISPCISGILSDQLTLGLFLKNFSTQIGEKLIESPHLVQREGIGQVGFCASSNGTIILETYIRRKEVIINCHNLNPNIANIQNYLISQLSLKPHQISLHRCSGEKEEIECEEPRCSIRATKTWGGRHICSDHYDQYNDEHTKFLRQNQDS
ncbi:hypothetical protein HYV86_05415 [Candidatus Woesearchaeota archaeon]|nr:hypothetical protein [Candidatus Woesearchaeota archaeon]